MGWGLPTYFQTEQVITGGSVSAIVTLYMNYP
ncbi:hypothetical protein ACUXQ2_002206 [Cupriavidus metallidurans]